MRPPHPYRGTTNLRISVDSWSYFSCPLAMDCELKGDMESCFVISFNGSIDWRGNSPERHYTVSGWTREVLLKTAAGLLIKLIN